jgi:hypothetical protein
MKKYIRHYSLFYNIKEQVYKKNIIINIANIVGRFIRKNKKLKNNLRRINNNKKSMKYL